MKKTFTYLLLFIFTFISTFTPYSASANMFPPPTFNNDMIMQQQQMNDQMLRQQQDLNNQMSQQQQDLERSMREMEEQNRELMRQQQEEMLRNMSFQEKMNEFARQMQDNTIKATFTIGTTAIVLTFPDPKEELIDLGKDILWDLFWEFVTEGILGVIFDGEHTPDIPEEETSGTDPPNSVGDSPIYINCFTENTLILTDRGPIPIDRIEVGDKVFSINENTGETAYKEVTRLHTLKTKHSYKIEFIRMNDNKKENIITTPEHPFWIKGKGWVKAKDLNKDDIVSTNNGETVKILKEPKERNTVQVILYNFKVADFNSYFISDLGIWVHNSFFDYLDYMDYKNAVSGHYYEIKVSNQPSTNLGKALTEVGIPSPAMVNNYGELRAWEAHHIVPEIGSNEDTIISQKILSKNEIEINSAVNGVWVPRVAGENTYKGTKWKHSISTHNGKHPPRYHRDVRIELQKIDMDAPLEIRQKQTEEILSNIRKKILEGKWILNETEEDKRR